MILPNEVEDIARDAYARFNEREPQGCEWSNLPETTRVRWRDWVIAAVKVRRRITDLAHEKCIYEVLDKRDVPQAEPPPEPALKPKRQSKVKE